MALNRKYHQNESYIDGNAVRQFPLIPEEEEYYQGYSEEDYEEQLEPDRYIERQRERKRQARTLEKRRPSIDLFSFLFLTGAMLLTAYVCIGYLQVQADLFKMNKNIAILESQIIDLKNSNAAKIEVVDETLPLEYVYEIAIKKYGMVHPSTNQIIQYDNIKSDVVRQYGDLPDGNKKNLLDDILGN